MTPDEFLARLAAIVPHPREHQLTYQGVLAPASPLRDSVVPRSVERKDPSAADAKDAGSSQCPAKQSNGQNYIPWAELLRRVFGEDVLRCRHCHGRRHMISVMTDPEAVRKVLESVREAVQRKKKPPPSGGGGEVCSHRSDDSPSPGDRIPMPPRQGRLEFEASGATKSTRAGLRGRRSNNSQHLGEGVG